MNDPGIQRPSAGWLFFVKLSFGLALLAVAIGLYFLPAEPWVKGYLAMGVLFLTGSTITLSKTVRDEHEALRLINRINEVKTEHLLRDLDGEARHERTSR